MLGRVGLGVLSHQIPSRLVDEVLAVTGRAERRFRVLPSRVGVYFVLALCLFSGQGYGGVIRALIAAADAVRLGRLGWCFPSSVALAKVRRRLGEAPFAVLCGRLCGLAPARRRPGSYAFGLRVCAWDGTEIDAPDTTANRRALARRSGPGFPKVRALVLMACDTRQLIDAALGGRGPGENTLARQILGSLGEGMLLLADRNFPGHGLWTAVTGTGCQALWRVGNAFHLPVRQMLPDGSYLSQINDPVDARRWRRNVTRNKKRGHRPPKPRPIQGVTVRVIESFITVTTADGRTRTEPYRLITSLTDWRTAPAAELAACYGRRWACETTFGDIKTGLLGAKGILRATDPELARQEVWAYLIVYQAIRLMIGQAAAAGDLDAEPARICFTAARDAARRAITTTPAQAAHTMQTLGPDLCRQLITRHTTTRICPRALKRPPARFPRKKAQPSSQNASYQITITPPNQPTQHPTTNTKPHQPAQPRAA